MVSVRLPGSAYLLSRLLAEARGLGRTWRCGSWRVRFDRDDFPDGRGSSGTAGRASTAGRRGTHRDARSAIHASSTDADDSGVWGSVVPRFGAASADAGVWKCSRATHIAGAGCYDTGLTAFGRPRPEGVRRVATGELDAGQSWSRHVGNGTRWAVVGSGGGRPTSDQSVSRERP